MPLDPDTDVALLYIESFSDPRVMPCPMPGSFGETDCWLVPVLPEVP